MVYGFAAKIKSVQKPEVLQNEELNRITSELDEIKEPSELRFVLPEDGGDDLLVKAQASVSSTTQSMHDKELEEAIENFKSYLEAFAELIGGEVSKQEGFYNNSQTFKKLYS
ncbi:MAG: hypothetical protein FWG68_12455 [Defluviitaleaceae bacterium]|nr:hypothetical protein [Defluviitaleaceae bacterium]